MSWVDGICLWLNDIGEFSDSDGWVRFNKWQRKPGSENAEDFTPHSHRPGYGKVT